MTTTRRRVRFAGWAMFTIVTTAIGPASLGGQPEMSVDTARLHAEVARKIERALARAEVNRAGRQLVNAVVAAKSVSASGTRLTSILGQDPALTAAGEAIVNAISEHPAVKKLFLKLARENPGLRSDQVAVLFSQRFTAMIESPAFDKAFKRAFAGVLERSEVVAATQRFERAAMANEEMNRALEAAVQRRTNEAVWSRLTELNGGTQPDSARAADLLAQYVFSESRIAQFYTKAMALPEVTSYCADACARLFDAPTFQAHLAKTLRPVARDNGVQRAAVATIVAILESDANAEKFEPPLTQFLQQPIVAKQFAALVNAILVDPALAQIGHDAISGISRDPAFCAALNALFDGW